MSPTGFSKSNQVNCRRFFVAQMLAQSYTATLPMPAPMPISEGKPSEKRGLLRTRDLLITKGDLGSYPRSPSDFQEADSRILPCWAERHR